MEMKKTLGAKNRNPLNIRYDPANKWLGQRGQNKGFCVFTSMRLGYRAAFMLLRTYIKKHNCTSIREIINRWAPNNENDTASYIDYVCNNFGCKGFQVSPDYCITTDKDLVNLVRPMSLLESRVDIADVCEPLDLLNTYNIHL